jgi:hypothetical protein
MVANKFQYEYAKRSESLRGYAAIQNKIIYILGVDCEFNKKLNEVYYFARYYFIDDPDRNIFRADTSIVTKLNQSTAETLYAGTRATIQRNSK